MQLCGSLEPAQVARISCTVAVQGVHARFPCCEETTHERRIQMQLPAQQMHVRAQHWTEDAREDQGSVRRAKLGPKPLQTLPYFSESCVQSS